MLSLYRQSHERGEFALFWLRHSAIPRALVVDWSEKTLIADTTLSMPVKSNAY